MRCLNRRLWKDRLFALETYVENGLLTFASKKTRDYHEDVKADVFEEYFKQMLEFV